MDVLPDGLGGHPGDRRRVPKRERTRRQLVAAAIRVFSARGIAHATIQEIAEAGEVTTGTVYNHFRTRADIVEAVGLWVAEALCRRIVESYADVATGAERLAIGCRRYIWLAETSPRWALLVLDVAASSPGLLQLVRSYVIADLRLGLRQKSFRISSQAAALDLIDGAVMQAMRSVALGRAPRGHGSALVAAILQALGLPASRARAVAARPLPPFPG